MSKYLFYPIGELTMTVHNENYDDKLDKILLIVRRIFLILFIGLILWILLFKIIGISSYDFFKTKSNTTNLVLSNISNIKKAINTKSIKPEDKNENEIDLGKHYSQIDNQIYYRGKQIPFVNTEKFIVINDGNHNIQGTVINSDNLLKIFADYNTRLYMMKHINSIIKDEKNTTNELKSASENGLYKMKNEQDILSKFKRDDRYDMTDQQRAKFAIMFLYIKIVKSMHNNEISMEVAIKELKYFIENFDKYDLKDEISDKKIERIKGNIGIDDHCIYKNGKLYACFLDKILIK